MNRLILLLSSILIPFSLDASQIKVASFDRNISPITVTDRDSFNKASALEILSYAVVIERTSKNIPEALSLPHDLIHSNLININRFLKRERKSLINSYFFATKVKVINWDSLIATAQKQLSIYNKIAWYKGSQNFFNIYFREQIRLAALFNKIPSEIFTFNNIEKTGSNLLDGEFILTVDDGPSEEYTLQLIDKLNENKIAASFFVLGERININKHHSLYSKQCVFAHGYNHIPHMKLEDSITSIDKTLNLIKKLNKINANEAFRPPYGMRSEEISSYLASKNVQTFLWSIDSQDWNSKVTEVEVIDRVKTLMLMKRKGIILFHDTHPKVLGAFPSLNKFIVTSNLKWIQCNKL